MDSPIFEAAPDDLCEAVSPPQPVPPLWRRSPSWKEEVPAEPPIDGGVKELNSRLIY